MAHFTALYDACVLYPAPLRDFLMQLALTDLFRAKWSNLIHDEWINNLLEDRPALTREKLERTRRLMNSHVRDCLVENFELLIPSIKLPDLNDRHVVAAAIVSRTDVIVTYNLRDFPKDALAPYGLEAQHPDTFIRHLIDLSSEMVYRAAQTCHQRLRNPPKSLDEFLITLEQQRLPQTTRILGTLMGSP